MIDLGAALGMVGEGQRADSFELFSRTLDMSWIAKLKFPSSAGPKSGIRGWFQGILGEMWAAKCSHVICA